MLKGEHNIFYAYVPWKLPYQSQLKINSHSTGNTEPNSIPPSSDNEVTDRGAIYHVTKPVMMQNTENIEQTTESKF